VRVPIEVVREFIQEHVPFNRFLGMELTRLDEGFCRIEMDPRPEFIGDPMRPALHGGVLSTLCDAAGGAAVWTKVEPLDRISTIDLRVDYLAPGRLARLVAEANVMRVGNRVGVVDVRIFHADEPTVTIAVARAVFSVKRGAAPEPAK
jgi:uncharacterized protein (TIGR00369 family)